MWILKIGGSWITSHLLVDLLKLLKKQAEKENILIVVGGGCFADSVRHVYKKKKNVREDGQLYSTKINGAFCLFA